MELSDILNSLSGSNETEKTASDNSATSSLSSAIDRALGGLEKTASHANPTPRGDLIKIANDLADAEQDALIKEAHIYGMAVADGFAARMSNYEAAGHSKVASHQGQENPQMLKEAMELGYIHAQRALARNAGQARGTTKIASHQQADAVKVASYQQGQADAVKVANYLKGKEDAVKVASEIVKVAQAYEDYGFKVGNSILRKL